MASTVNSRNKPNPVRAGSYLAFSELPAVSHKKTISPKFFFDLVLLALLVCFLVLVFVYTVYRPQLHFDP